MALIMFNLRKGRMMLNWFAAGAFSIGFPLQQQRNPRQTVGNGSQDEQLIQANAEHSSAWMSKQRTPG
jgi:hypothetical protein